MRGEFSREFAKKKTWKLDSNLCKGLLAVLPKGCSVIDIGAGIGRYVEWLNTEGHRAWGVDNIEDIGKLSSGRVWKYDLSSDPVFFNLKNEQWGICIEVGEHIPPELEAAFIENVSKCARNGLIVSWAVLGQRGKNHINCHSTEYVANRFGRWGWHLDEGATALARVMSGKGWDKKLLVFKRESTRKEQ